MEVKNPRLLNVNDIDGNVCALGCTIILRRGFSASQFWQDCVKYEATVGQYIGEVARFLLGRELFELFCC